MGSMHSEQLRIRVLSALIKERKRQGLTITEVARRIGTSRSRISEIENSRTETITLTMLADYCKALDVEPIFAFKRNGMARLTDIAEELGWKVFMDGNESMCDYNMEKYSPKGQDFNCTIILEKKTPQEMIERLEDYIEGYDPFYEASLWTVDGHGINGAPDDPREVIKDMEDCKAMMQDLLNRWKEAVIEIK